MKNNVKKVCLTVITENQTEISKANKLAEIIVRKLGESSKIVNIESYYKFDNSFKIEIEFDLHENNKAFINNCLISNADKIASPWLIYYDNMEESIELIFNKNENSRENNSQLNEIKWGHWQVVY